MNRKRKKEKEKRNNRQASKMNEAEAAKNYDWKQRRKEEK
jgi:hypothetical protein